MIHSRSPIEPVPVLPVFPDCTLKMLTLSLVLCVISLCDIIPVKGGDILITIRVSSLLHAASMMSNERYNYVDVSISEGFTDEDGEVYPTTLHFDVYDKYGCTESWDELDIEEVDPPKMV